MFQPRAALGTSRYLRVWLRDINERTRGKNVTKINKTKLALLGATALFSATSAHAQVADTWTIGGDVLVTSSNTAETVSLDNTEAAFIDGANIAAGYKNSISGATVGSSASSSFTYFNNSTVASSTTATIDGGLTVIAGNSAAVTNTNDLTTAPTIAAGSGNSISLAAVGSSASGSATTTIAGGATEGDVSYEIGGDVLIQSGDGIAVADAADVTVGGNTGAVTLVFAEGIATPTITTGNSNSISGAAVGSSASFSLAVNSTDASTLTSVNYTVGNVNVNSTNSEDGIVTVGLDGGANAAISGANIQAGDANSISVAGVGASASVSQSNSIHSAPAAGGGPAAGDVLMGDVAVNGFNAASITVGAALTDTPTIAAGSNNSISVAGVGSSASVSFGVADYSAAGVSALVTSSGGITVASLNTGIVAVTGGMATPTISDGYNNSISNAAVGSSASQAISHLNLAVPG